jgi:hypothetical protein
VQDVDDRSSIIRAPLPAYHTLLLPLGFAIRSLHFGRERGRAIRIYEWLDCHAWTDERTERLE